MGGQTSKVSTESVSEIIANTTINGSKSCAQRSINSQTVTIRSTGTVKIDELILDQSAFTTLNCVMESTNQTNFDATLASELTNQILQDQGWGATGAQKTVIQNNIKNIIQSNNLIDDVQNVFQDTMNEQNLKIEADEDGSIIVGVIHLNQAITSSAEALQKSAAVVDIAAYLNNTVYNEVEHKMKGVDAIVDSVLGFLAQFGWMGVALAIAAFIGFIWLLSESSPEQIEAMKK